MAVVSRLQLNHPALGTAGGAGLHTSIEALYQKMGDAVDSRWFELADFDQTETVDLLHNFDTDIANLRWDFWNFTGGQWVKVTSATTPAIANFAVIAKVGFESTTLQITNNAGGNDLTFAVSIVNDPIYLSEGDVEDVDLITAAPEDGQALVYDSTTSKFKPGASGDSSFKVQSIATPNAVIKGGYLQLANGKELATYDGAGSASTDFGKDLTVSLTTIFGSAPANATAYYLYIDLSTVAGSPTTLSDNGRQLYPIVEANFVIMTTAPEAATRTRYIPIAVIKSATSGTQWSGTGSAFASLAKFKHTSDSESSGSGGINYIANPSAQTDTSGWGVSGAMTITRTTTASDLPREGLHAHALYLEAGASADYIRYRFTLGDSDKSAPIQIKAALKALNSYVYGDLKFQMFTNTASNYSGGYTELPVTNADIANDSYEHLAYFIATGADYYELRIKRNNSSTSKLTLSDVTVGPFSGVVGPSIGSWKTYTPTISNLGTGSISSVDGFYREVGDGLEILVGWIKDGSAGSGASAVGVSMPSGFTLNGSGLSNNASNLGGGVGYFTGGVWSIFSGYPAADTGTNTVILISGGGAWTGANIAAGDRYQYMLRVPVNELQPVVNVVNTMVEYAHNNGTWDATDTTSFSYGPGGAAIGGAITATRLKTVQFKTPILPTDIIKLQGSDDGITWININEGILNTTPFVGIGAHTVIDWGAYFIPTSATTVRVSFSVYQWARTDGSSPTGWTSGYWRVVKCANPLGLGLPPRAPDTMGEWKTGNGLCTTTKVSRMTTESKASIGWVWTDSSADSYWTCVIAGDYTWSWSIPTSATSRRGFSLNADAALNTNWQALSASLKLRGTEIAGADGFASVSERRRFALGDKIRLHGDGATDGSVPGDAGVTVSG